MFVQRHNNKYIAELRKGESGRTSSSKLGRMTLSESQYRQFRIKKILDGSEGVHLDPGVQQSKVIRPTNSLYEKLLFRQQPPGGQAGEQQVMAGNSAALKETTFYREYESLVGCLQHLGGLVQGFRLNKLSLEQEVLAVSGDKMSREKKIGFQLKELMESMERLFSPMLQSEENLLTKSNLSLVQKNLKVLGQGLGELMKQRANDNEQYLVLLDSFWLLLTVMLDRVIQSCLFREDQSAKEALLEHHADRIRVLEENQLVLEEELADLKVAAESSKRQGEEAVAKLKEENAYLKKEVETYIDKLGLAQNQEDDPNDIFLSMEISFSKQNQMFSRLEQGLHQRHQEQLQSLNSFAVSFKDNLQCQSLSRKSISQLQQAQSLSKNNIHSQYALYQPTPYFKNDPHPFVYHLLKKSVYTKLKHSPSTNTLLDTFFASLSLPTTSPDFPKALLTHLFATSPNILSVSIKVNDVCDFLVREGPMGEKRGLWRRLLGVGKEVPPNRAQGELFQRLVTITPGDSLCFHQDVFFPKASLLKTLSSRLNGPCAPLFLESLQTLLSAQAARQLKLYRANLKAPPASSRLLLRLSLAFDTKDFFSIKERLSSLFSQNESWVDCCIPLKDFQEVQVGEHRLFSECVQESFFTHCLDNGLVHWPSFLRLLQRQSVSPHHDEDFIEEFSYYSLLLEAVSAFYAQQIESIRQQVALQIQEDSFFRLHLPSPQFFPVSDGHAFFHGLFPKVMSTNLLGHYIDTLEKAKTPLGEMAYLLKTHNKNEMLQNLDRCIHNELINYPFINSLLLDPTPTLSPNKAKIKKQFTQKKVSTAKNKK